MCRVSLFFVGLFCFVSIFGYSPILLYVHVICIMIMITMNYLLLVFACRGLASHSPSALFRFFPLPFYFKNLTVFVLLIYFFKNSTETNDLHAVTRGQVGMNDTLLVQILHSLQGVESDRYQVLSAQRVRKAAVQRSSTLQQPSDREKWSIEQVKDEIIIK